MEDPSASTTTSSTTTTTASSSTSSSTASTSTQSINWPERPSDPRFALLFDSLRRLALVEPYPIPPSHNSPSRNLLSTDRKLDSNIKNSSKTNHDETKESAAGDCGSRTADSRDVGNDASRGSGVSENASENGDGVVSDVKESESNVSIDEWEGAEWAGAEGRHPMERVFRELTRTERSYLHELAKSIGFVHFSEGTRKTRTLHVLRNPRPLPVARFCHETLEWKVETLDPNYESTTTPAGKLRVITFNVLTDISPTYRIDDLILSHLRWPAILNILKDTDADVIALQEVSASFHKLLMAEPWVRKSCVVSDPFGKTLEPMGNLLLSRIPMRKVEERSYQSQDHGIVKSAVIAETMVNGRRLALAVVHLKAGTAFADRRKAQLEETIQMLREVEADDRIILGDFNMRDVAKERNEELEREYSDLWEVLHGPTSEPGHESYTFDLVNNLMSKAISDRVSEMKNSEGHSSRFDRIELNSNVPVVALGNTSVEGAHWVVEDMRMIANECIHRTESGTELWPSDHYGLTLTLQFVRSAK